MAAQIKKLNIRTLFTISLYILAFAIVTIIEFLSVQSGVDGEVILVFSLKTFKRSLAAIFINYVAIAMYITATLSFEINKFKSNNKQYIVLKENIGNFAEKNYVPTIFNQYCTIKNRERKIHAYKHKLHKQWQKLEKLQTYKNYEIWNSYIKAKDADNNTPVPNNRYCKMRLRLEEKMSEEYIEANIDKLHVRYDALSSSVVLGGKVASNIEDYQDEFITKHKAMVVVADRAPHYLFMMAVMTFASSLAVEAFTITFTLTGALLLAFKMITKVCSMIFTIIGTIKYAVGYNDTITLKDMTFRWGICHEFNNWVSQKAKGENNEQ